MYLVIAIITACFYNRYKNVKEPPQYSSDTWWGVAIAFGAFWPITVLFFCANRFWEWVIKK